MPISLILTPFDHFQIRLTFAVTPNLILEPCLRQVPCLTFPKASEEGNLTSGDPVWGKSPNLFRHFPCIACWLGRGPRQKNGKILTELSFFAVFNHKNDLEKVWKSRNEFKLVGFKVEKNGPCSRENEVKISKNCKMAKNDFSRSDLGS